MPFPGMKQEKLLANSPWFVCGEDEEVMFLQQQNQKERQISSTSGTGKKGGSAISISQQIGCLIFK